MRTQQSLQLRAAGHPRPAPLRRRAGTSRTTTAGFPNLFILAGPNTGIGHTSLIYIIEAQIAYITQALELMDSRGIASLEVRPDVKEAWDEHVQRKLSRSVWNSGGCVSYYLDDRGRNPTLWPDFTFAYAKRVKRFDLESYYQELRPLAA